MMPDAEIWKDVKGYEGYYRVSNKGNVRGYRHGDRLLKPLTDGHGYSFICLCVNGVKKNRKIHRMVAEAFIPNPDNLPCINHKDENKANNHVDNVEWCTYSYNNLYGTRPLIQSERRGTKVIQKTKEGKVVRVWRSQLLAGKTLGICDASISRCRRGVQPSAGGFIWEAAL